MTADDEGPLDPDDAHDVLAAARAAGADLGAAWLPATPIGRAERLVEAGAFVRAFNCGDGAPRFEGRAIGFWTCPVMAIDVGEIRSRAWPVHLLQELDLPDPATQATSSRPGAEQIPTLADMATARAMSWLRPAAPWESLPASARQALSIAAMPLRRALIAAGWTPPMTTET